MFPFVRSFVTGRYYLKSIDFLFLSRRAITFFVFIYIAYSEKTRCNAWYYLVGLFCYAKTIVCRMVLYFVSASIDNYYYGIFTCIFLIQLLKFLLIFSFCPWIDFSFDLTFIDCCHCCQYVLISFQLHYCFWFGLTAKFRFLTKQFSLIVVYKHQQVSVFLPFSLC